MFISEPWLVPDTDEYDGFYEESQFDEMIYELKDALKKSVKKEFTDKVKELEEKLAELQEFKDQKESYDREMKNLKYKLEQSEKSIEERAARMRVSDVLLTLKKETWVPDCKWEYVKKKCDKCDDSRTLRFKSPLGKELSERCSCSVQIPVHFPARAFLVEIDNDDFYKNIKSELPSTKLSYISGYDIEKDSDGDYRFKYCTLYNGEDFDKLGSSSIYFRDREYCERYCKWLNDKYIKNNNIEVEVEL